MIPIARPYLPQLATYVSLLEEIWNSRLLSSFGKYAELLERKAQSYLGNPYVCVVANCDLGLTIALAALEIPKGSECILPSFTFNSTANAAVWNSLMPVFADIDPETFTIDPVDVANRITDKTRVVIGTHIFGNPCKVEELREIATRAQVWLLFDTAHAYGALYQGRKVGTLEAIEVFSLDPTKLVTSAEGGLVACPNASVANRIRHVRNHGFLRRYESKYIGLNARISELNAALGFLTLDYIEAAVARRHEIAARYRAGLGDIAGLKFQAMCTGNRSTFSHFAIVCEQGRDGLQDYLSQEGIQTKKYFRPLHQMRFFAQYSHEELPKTQWLAEHILCLPIFNDLADSQVDYICEKARAYFEALLTQN